MKILAFDCESNGLHGEIFAIGAMCAGGGEAPDDFAGRVLPPEPVDEWVAQHVLPFINSVPMYDSPRQLRDEFWAWLQAHKKDAVIVADFGTPVEARLLADCQKDDSSRTWDHPYPLHELGTMLLAAGVDPDVDRHEYSPFPWNHPGSKGHKHNPLDDAYIVAHCWKKAHDTLQAQKKMIKDALDMLDKAGVWTGADDLLLDRLSMALSQLEHARKNNAI